MDINVDQEVVVAAPNLVDNFVINEVAEPPANADPGHQQGNDQLEPMIHNPNGIVNFKAGAVVVERKERQPPNLEYAQLAGAAEPRHGRARHNEGPRGGDPNPQIDVTQLENLSQFYILYRKDMDDAGVVLNPRYLVLGTFDDHNNLIPVQSRAWAISNIVNFVNLIRLANDLNYASDVLNMIIDSQASLRLRELYTDNLFYDLYRVNDDVTAFQLLTELCTGNPVNISTYERQFINKGDAKVKLPIPDNATDMYGQSVKLSYFKNLGIPIIKYTDNTVTLNPHYKGAVVRAYMTLQIYERYRSDRSVIFTSYFGAYRDYVLALHYDHTVFVHRPTTLFDAKDSSRLAAIVKGCVKPFQMDAVQEEHETVAFTCNVYKFGNFDRPVDIVTHILQRHREYYWIGHIYRGVVGVFYEGEAIWEVSGEIVTHWADNTATYSHIDWTPFLLEDRSCKKTFCEFKDGLALIKFENGAHDETFVETLLLHLRSVSCIIETVGEMPKLTEDDSFYNQLISTSIDWFGVSNVNNIIKTVMPNWTHVGVKLSDNIMQLTDLRPSSEVSQFNVDILQATYKKRLAEFTWFPRISTLFSDLLTRAIHYSSYLTFKKQAKQKISAQHHFSLKRGLNFTKAAHNMSGIFNLKYIDYYKVAKLMGAVTLAYSLYKLPGYVWHFLKRPLTLAIENSTKEETLVGARDLLLSNFVAMVVVAPVMEESFKYVAKQYSCLAPSVFGALEAITQYPMVINQYKQLGIPTRFRFVHFMIQKVVIHNLLSLSNSLPLNIVLHTLINLYVFMFSIANITSQLWSNSKDVKPCMLRVEVFFLLLFVSMLRGCVRVARESNNSVSLENITDVQTVVNYVGNVEDQQADTYLNVQGAQDNDNTLISIDHSIFDFMTVYLNTFYIHRSNFADIHLLDIVHLEPKRCGVPRLCPNKTFDFKLNQGINDSNPGLMKQLSTFVQDGSDIYTMDRNRYVSLLLVWFNVPIYALADCDYSRLQVAKKRLLNSPPCLGDPELWQTMRRKLQIKWDYQLVISYDDRKMYMNHLTRRARMRQERGSRRQFSVKYVINFLMKLDEKFVVDFAGREIRNVDVSVASNTCIYYWKMSKLFSVFVNKNVYLYFGNKFHYEIACGYKAEDITNWLLKSLDYCKSDEILANLIVFGDDSVIIMRDGRELVCIETDFSSYDVCQGSDALNFAHYVNLRLGMPVDVIEHMRKLDTAPVVLAHSKYVGGSITVKRTLAAGRNSGAANTSHDNSINTGHTLMAIIAGLCGKFECTDNFIIEAFKKLGLVVKVKIFRGDECFLSSTFLKGKWWKVLSPNRYAYGPLPSKLLKSVSSLKPPVSITVAGKDMSDPLRYEHAALEFMNAQAMNFNTMLKVPLIRAFVQRYRQDRYRHVAYDSENFNLSFNNISGCAGETLDEDYAYQFLSDRYGLTISEVNFMESAIYASDVYCAVPGRWDKLTIDYD